MKRLLIIPLLLLLTACSYEGSAVELEIKSYNDSVASTVSLYDKTYSYIEENKKALQTFIVTGEGSEVLSFSGEVPVLSSIEDKLSVERNPVIDELFTFTGKKVIKQRQVYSTPSGVIFVTIVWDEKGIVSVDRGLTNEEKA